MGLFKKIRDSIKQTLREEDQKWMTIRDGQLRTVAPREDEEKFLEEWAERKERQNAELIEKYLPCPVKMVSLTPRQFVKKSWYNARSSKYMCVGKPRWSIYCPIHPGYTRSLADSGVSAKEAWRVAAAAEILHQKNRH
jgi:hypothetical protein